MGRIKMAKNVAIIILIVSLSLCVIRLLGAFYYIDELETALEEADDFLYRLKM